MEEVVGNGTLSLKTDLEEEGLRGQNVCARVQYRAAQGVIHWQSARLCELDNLGISQLQIRPHIMKFRLFPRATRIKDGNGPE